MESNTKHQANNLKPSSSVISTFRAKSKSINQQPNSAVSAANIKKASVFYRIEKTGFPTSYMFGTMHAATFRSCPYYPEKSEGFQNATHFILEIKTSDEEYKQITEYNAAVKRMEEVTLGEVFDMEDEKDRKQLNPVYEKILNFFEQYPSDILPKDSKLKARLLKIKDEKETALSNKNIAELIKDIRKLLERKYRKFNFSSLRFWSSPSLIWASLRLYFWKRKFNLEKLKVAPAPSFEHNIVELPESLQNQAIDARILESAKVAGKEIVGLETQEEQIRAFSFDPSIQKTIDELKAVRDMIIEYPELIMFKSLEILIEPLKADPRKCLINLQNYFTDLLSQKITEVQVSRYNNQTLQQYNEQLPVRFTTNKEVRREGLWMPDLLKTIMSHPSFIVVGLGHLGGDLDSTPEDGLIYLLSKEGFMVTPVECPRIDELELNEPENNIKAEKTPDLTTQAHALTFQFNHQETQPFIKQETQSSLTQAIKPSATSKSLAEISPKKRRTKARKNHWTRRKSISRAQ